MDVYFMFDLLLNFNTGYESRGTLVLIRHRIIFNYLKSWFIIDIAATLPYTWMFGEGDERFYTQVYGNESASSNAQILKLFKIIRFLRILRLLRVLKI